MRRAVTSCCECGSDSATNASARSETRAANGGANSFSVVVIGLMEKKHVEYGRNPRVARINGTEIHVRLRRDTRRVSQRRCALRRARSGRGRAA